MLKQPDRIVIYPKKDSNLDYLLCWIPLGNFAFVSRGNAGIESELKDYYPTGIETEFSQDGFDEFGISLPKTYDLDVLREAYMELSMAGLLTEVVYVDVKRLKNYVSEKDKINLQEMGEKLSKEEITLEEMKLQYSALGKLLEEPKMKGRQDPEEAFQQMSGKLESDDE